MKKIIFRILIFFMPLFARFFKVVAVTGKGTDICLENGFLPVPVHFYQPIPDLKDLDERNVWDKKSDLVGIDFGVDRQVQLLKELGTKYGNECNWPALASSRSADFYTENNSFSFGCAAGLHTIIRSYKPRKIIEIGSGNSSKVISAAVALNKADGNPCKYQVIDPYPSQITEDRLDSLSTIIKERVELTDLSAFADLRKNDILFIDSGHTVRTGSDVNFLFLEVLPRLAPGVFVHFHDINLPYEYPEIYFTNPSFRMFWTESYLLQAFLIFNSQFKVILAMHYLMRDKNEEFRAAFTHYDPTKHRAMSGSFWIQRDPDG